MRAVVANALSPALDLSVAEIPMPAPASRQVRVRVHAAAVNPADHKVLSGSGAGRFLHARALPLVAGYDFAGVVDALGEGVTDLDVGDEVFGHLAYSSRNRQGTFAEFVTVDTQTLAHKPRNVSHDVAAAAATAGLTALQGLRDKGGLRTRGRAFITGASGGVGSVAVGVAKRMGAQVTAVCSSHAVEFVRELGADIVVDRSKANPLAGVSSYDVFFDAAAAFTYAACRRLIAPSGAYVTTLPSLGLFVGMVLAPLSGQSCAVLVVESKRSDLKQLGRWIGEGLRIPIAARYRVREAAAAVRRVAEGRKLGRIVVQVEGGW